MCLRGILKQTDLTLARRRGFGEQRLDDARLTIPHYGMKERAFVLVPLFDLAPDLQLPCGSWLRDLVASCDRSGLRPLAESSQA